MREPEIPTPNEWMKAPHACREYASWCGIRIAELEEEVELYRTALHDSIRRPMGVVPDSADELYDQDYYEGEGE
jgi:hypothetical protein